MYACIRICVDTHICIRVYMYTPPPMCLHHPLRLLERHAHVHGQMTLADLRAPSQILSLCVYNTLTVSAISRRRLLVVHTVYRLYLGKHVYAQCRETMRGAYKLCTVSACTHTVYRLYPGKHVCAQCLQTMCSVYMYAQCLQTIQWLQYTQCTHVYTSG